MLSLHMQGGRHTFLFTKKALLTSLARQERHGKLKLDRLQLSYAYQFSPYLPLWTIFKRYCYLLNRNLLLLFRVLAG